MKLTLRVYEEEEVTFSEKELIAIVEKHLQAITEVAPKPTEGKWFQVKPNTINKKLFEKKRDDEMQEDTRQRIKMAFREMEERPRRYGVNFKTMMPKDMHTGLSMDLEARAKRRGNGMADWVHQALEWAQRISNGETWESVCNDPDTANWQRLVKSWFNGRYLLVGGSVKNGKKYPASKTHYNAYSERHDWFDGVVPLVVFYDE